MLNEEISCLMKHAWGAMAPHNVEFDVVHMADTAALEIRCWVTPLLDLVNVCRTHVSYERAGDRETVENAVRMLIANVLERHEKANGQGVGARAQQVPGEEAEELLPVRQAHGG